jgi:hypothetical protein
VTHDEAKERLLELARAEAGYFNAEMVERDPTLSANQDIVSAAAHELATDPAVDVGEEADGRAWFPYSFMRFSAPLVG